MRRLNETLSLLAVAGLSFILLWRIVQVNAVLYDDTGRPRIAAPFGLNPLGAPAPENTSSKASERESLFGVLRENPAEVAAMLMLARNFDSEVEASKAARAYDLAYQLAPLDREVLSEAATFRLHQNDVAGGIALLDRLAELYPETRERVFPVLAQTLISRNYAGAWDAIAARDPNWIGSFLLASCNRGIDPAALAPLLQKRVASGKAASNETACLVDHLRIAGRWEEAYQVWLNILPRERLADVGFVFNGSFEYPSTGVGFDWMLAQGPAREVGHSAEIAPTLGSVGKRAMRVTYNGKRQVGSPAAQFLALVPGRYELSGAARPEGLKMGRGVQWILRCVAQGKAQAPFANSERFIGSSEWRRFAFEITVAPDCEGQILQLEPVDPDQGVKFLDGVVWFDDLVVRRIK